MIPPLIALFILLVVLGILLELSTYFLLKRRHHAFWLSLGSPNPFKRLAKGTPLFHFERLVWGRKLTQNDDSLLRLLVILLRIVWPAKVILLLILAVGILRPS